MHPHLTDDLANLRTLLERTVEEAQLHLDQLDVKPTATPRLKAEKLALPDDGLGAAHTLELFAARYGRQMAAVTGPRFWGFVTGGTTPAALMGDWLVSAYDVNASHRQDSVAPDIELEAIAMLRELFGLPEAFHGVFVSGATMSNFTALALAREWVSQQHGHSSARDGLYHQTPIKILSAAPHSSILKALSMLGMGRGGVVPLAKVDSTREAVEIADLERQLAALNGEPCIVSASAGTVNTVDFDDLRAIAALKARYPFWMHVDGAFGGFAACSAQYRHLTAGMELADSVTIDAHKWLNVPYDSAMVFTRHSALHPAVFQNNAAYLGEIGDEPDFVHLTPETSRRLRALPAWFTLMAYGKAGYAEIVERNCATARLLGEKIAQSDHFELLAPVRMNVVCFTLKPAPELTPRFLAELRADGRVYLTPTVYNGVPGMRAAFSNWRTTEADVELAWTAMQEIAARVKTV